MKTLFFFAAFLALSPAEGAFSCAYQLVGLLEDAEVQAPQGFEVSVASPRLLLGRFPTTPMPGIAVLDRATFKELGVIWSCPSGKEAYYPIYLDQKANGNSTGTAHLGQGLGKEAKFAILAYAFGPKKMQTVYARVHPSNAASLALHRSLGFRETDIRSVPPFVREFRAMRPEEMLYFKMTAQDFAEWDEQRDKSEEGLARFFNPAPRLQKRTSITIRDFVKLSHTLVDYFNALGNRLSAEKKFQPVLAALEKGDWESARAHLSLLRQQAGLQALLATVIDPGLAAGPQRDPHKQSLREKHAPLVPLHFYLFLAKYLTQWSPSKALELWAALFKASRGELLATDIPSEGNQNAVKALAKELRTTLKPFFETVEEVFRKGDAERAGSSESPRVQF